MATSPAAEPPPGRGPAERRRPTSSAVGQHSLREQNIALVAQEIFDAATPPSRADVAASTGLARATVSALVDRLVEARIVAELPPLASRRAGRPAVPLAPAPGTIVGVGLEVTVGHLGGTVLDLTGSVLASQTVVGDFHDSDPGRTLGLLGALTADLLSTARAQHGIRIAGVQIALPGLVDASTSTLHVAPNLGWAGLSPVDVGPVAAHTGQAPITLGNEANLAALAQVSPARSDHPGPDSFLYVSAGVGIGAAIVLDRELFLGGRGWSGELGHVVVDPAGPRCECGATGCLEQYAGTEAILRAAGLTAPSTAPGAQRLRAAVTAGDEAASAALDRAGRALGAALADFINLIDIPAVMLGGDFSALADLLTPAIDAELRTRVLSAPWTTFTIDRAPVRADAATTGGARQVLRAVVDDPSPWLG